MVLDMITQRKKIDESLYLGPIPSYLSKYADLLLEWFKESPNQVIVNEYLPGQGISKHIDCVSCFDNTIASISLLSSCVMDFEKLNFFEEEFQLLKPLSVLILQDEARYRWLHSISPRTKDLWNDETLSRGRRISLTFRKVILS